MSSLSSRLTAVVTFILLFGCTEDLDVVLPFEGPRLSVVARIDPADGFNAFITRTGPPTGEQELSTLIIEDANVFVLIGSDTLNVPSVGEGFYQLENLDIVEGTRCKMIVAANGLGALESEWVTIPRAMINPTLIETVTRDTLTPPEFFRFRRDSVRLDFTATDPEEATWFLIDIVHNQRFPTGLNYDAFSGFDTEVCEVNRFNSIFFPDRCTASEAWSYTLFPDINIFDDNSNRVEFDNYVFTVRSISEVYYSYLLDRLNVDDIRGVILEPRPSTTNVTGGYGVLLASNGFRRILDTP